MEKSVEILKILCSHILDVEEEQLLRHYMVAANLLSQEMPGCVVDNLETVTDQCKKQLVKEKRLHDSGRLATLLNRLQKSTILQNKAGLLSFFLALGQDNNSLYNHSRSGASSSLSSGLQNHSDDFFHLPSLHSSISHGSSSSGGAQSSSRPASATNDEMEYSGSSSQVSSTIARLAAIYKAQIQVSESSLIREMLFIFQGIDGKIIKFDNSRDCYKIDSKVGLSPSQKQLILKLTEVGWLYMKIKRFCDSHCTLTDNAEKIASNVSSIRNYSGKGLVNQSFVLALREQLNECCRLVASLELEINDTGGRDTPLEDNIGGLTLRQLLLWTWEPRSNLTTLAQLTDSAQDYTGGALVSALYDHMHHGDPSHVAIVKRSLTLACTPLYRMLTQWLLDGTLEDPLHEFFISADPVVPHEKLWHDKYDIRYSMLPSFITEYQAVKVLSTGKSLNFLRHVCHFRDPISGRDAIRKALQETTVESLFNQEDYKLNRLLDLTFRETSAHVLEEILTQHKLVDHLRALKRYLLLGQGDFIHYLMEILEPELCKLAANLHPHNLNSLLETAVAASNAQYEEPDILKRLNVLLLETSPGDSGWDVFSLSYAVDGPIGTVLTGECMNKYLMLFNSLWRAKHMERILNATWKQQSATSKLCRSVPELQSTLHGIQLLLTEMIHLVQQMAYYTTFEVLECSWEALMSCLKEARSLDDIIDAHNEFIKKIVAGALLDKNSEDIRIQLRTVYELMTRLERLQEHIYKAVVCEVNARKNYENLIEEQTNLGNFGVTAEEEKKESMRKKLFVNHFVPKIKSQLTVLSQTYQDVVQSFLLVLAQHEDENLHLLSSRLDFNEHYHRRDHRLNQRLTYHHKRKSMGGREGQ